MKIIGIGGSLRHPSCTYQVLQLALKRINSKNGNAELIDLRELKLPFCDGSDSYTLYPDVEYFKHQVKTSNGILLASPEYHGSVSGVLKNALDLLDEDDIRGKVVGLIAVLGGVHSTNAINTLRIICRQLHCWVLPDQLVIPHVRESLSEQGQFKDPSHEERLNIMIDHFVSAVHRFSI
ncbi:MAG: NAD(P)H-dependent oxidoreductase [Parachlamydiaceae bacterium]|nr:NAD(P)H-dependent oxidoreductase [Parachlamydiaceae bacterium]